MKKAEKTLPARGAFAGHWAYLSQGRVRKDDAWLDLDRRIERSQPTKVR